MLIMKKLAAAALAGGLTLVSGCASNKRTVDVVQAAKPVEVSTAAAISREVPAD